ncbi:helix-hairpin-helix domain-containing protein [Arthrobacter sp. H35-D1]|uniref:helix-hairpin-helix domain-containing protein n=1 Tax=Arthrobacter sp. H35-D1 TaxID=3046202 RepID=UPI0024BB8351|nr:helix-hairpin-helix domain-containing protein [Arthrobacter sp. H35-D1]MDJ0313408.1 helix-hairpin-helix domain-containing protein [Arthrobacter sp. H35-D1]
MNDPGEADVDDVENAWAPSRSTTTARGEAAGQVHGPRWLVSLRALVVALAMMAAALGVMWLESAGVQEASAQLATDGAGQVAVPPLDGSVTPTAGVEGTRSEAGGDPSLPAGQLPSSFALPAPAPLSSAGLRPSAGKLPDRGLVVHVAGAVKSPGVFILNPNSRVFQAVEAAGGALPTAELAALNLAAPVSDGLQILVPTKEQAAAMPANPGMGGQAPGPAEKAVPGSGQDGAAHPLNLNTATAVELETLPGVGPVLAERIVVWRTDHGPYPSVDALDAVTGIGAKLLAGLRDLVVVQ